MANSSFRTRFAHRLMASIAFALMLGLPAIFFAGCSRAQPPPQPIAPERVTPPALSRADLEAAKAAVTTYLRAIYAQDYQTAYDLLSAESKRRHSQEAFIREARGAQVLYDLSNPRAEGRGENAAEVVVSLQQEEEPGAKAFSVARENGQWKVIYYAGKPLFPYAE